MPTRFRVWRSSTAKARCRSSRSCPVSVCEYVFQGRKDNLRKACDAPGQQAGEPEAIDADGDGNLSKAEIQARLAELDIPYHKNANKGVLLETLRDGLAQLLDEAEVPYDEQASVEVLYHLLPRGEGEANRRWVSCGPSCCRGSASRPRAPPPAR